MTAHRYDRLGPYYDALAWIYSGGGIARAKRRHVATFEAGERVLYLGSGTGAECVHAARQGALVTLVDQSPAMMRRARARFDRAGLDARFLCRNALDPHLVDGAHFDVIVAPFFLNTLTKAELPDLFSHWERALRRGGRVVTVDFRRPVESLFSSLQRLYYLPPLLLFWTLTRNPWHELYDYPTIVERSAPRLALTTSLTDNAWGLPFLETLIWERE